MRFLLLLLLLLNEVSQINAQVDTLVRLKKSEYHTLMAGSGFASLIYLHQAWYSSYASPSFHFFNDWQEWLQMDKAGHLFSSFKLARAGYKLATWARYDKSNAFLWGGLYSLGFMTGLEILDGFSAGWGFSWGDFAFDLAGIALFAASTWLDTMQGFTLKFSFWPTSYPAYNPQLLGKSLPYQVLKDYNGQTYWITFRPSAMFDFFPRWLGFSIGYGADGMIGASYNPEIINGQPIPYVERGRQYFFSLDILPVYISTKQRWARFIFHSLGAIKFPAPAFELTSKNQIRWHWIYF